MYDEFTRDILIEETLLVRVYGKTDASDGRNQATEFRRVALTSNYLVKLGIQMMFYFKAQPFSLSIDDQGEGNQR